MLEIIYSSSAIAGVTSLQFVLHTPCQFYEVIFPYDERPQLVWFDFKSVKVKHRMMDGHGWNDVSVLLVLNRFCFASCLNNAI